MCSDLVGGAARAHGLWNHKPGSYVWGRTPKAGVGLNKSGGEVNKGWSFE